jgi:PTH1 family peptidyl-tRNA hydrolase
VEELAKRHRILLNRTKYRSTTGQGPIAGATCLLALPQTYMNLSGQAVRRMLTYTGTPAEKLLAVHDDLDLPLGRMRLRRGGGSGGHRGISSIADSIGESGFMRLKIGIGRPPEGMPAENYVLSRFNKREAPLIASALENAAEAVEMLISDGLERTMSRFNAGH